MVNTNEILIERNKELLNKIEELEKIKNTEISKEAQLKVINKVLEWEKENYETGERLKKYQGNTYPAHITDNTTDELPLWRQLASHVSFELSMVRYLHKKENPLNELIEMMLNSITQNVVNYYNSEGLREEERREYEGKINKHKGKIEKLLNETFPFDKLKENPLEWDERIGGVERGYLDTINGKDYSNYVINFYKEREEEFKNKELIIKELEENLKMEEENANVHLEAIKVCENWYLTHHITPLNKEVANKSDLLQASEKIVESQREKIERLEREAIERTELLNEAQRLIENQGELLKLTDKPLPKIPSKFKLFKEKTKTKFRQFQKVAKKAKAKTREFIARVEVKTK